jgi:hypothetical protein
MATFLQVNGIQTQVCTVSSFYQRASGEVCTDHETCLKSVSELRDTAPMLEQLPAILQEHTTQNHQGFTCIPNHEERATHKFRRTQTAECTGELLRAKDRTFNLGETILARKYLKGPKWVAATVIAQAGLVLHCPHGRGRHLEKAHRSVTVE